MEENEDVPDRLISETCNFECERSLEISDM